jgi:hypothetical protein
MSQEWKPEDYPPDEPTQRRPLRRLPGDDKQEAELPALPLAWLLIGALAGLLTVGLLGLGAISILRKQESRPPVTVTPAALPESPVSTAAMPTEGGPPALRPTFTPTLELVPPTPAPPTDTPTPGVPDKITVGGYVRVEGAGEAGLSFRSGPGTNYARYKVVEEGTALLVLQEPRQAEGFTWWFLRDPEGIEGWAVQDFLIPTAPPSK